MGNVWRADRPQRGRYRQFMQCDIDILGEPTNLAEIELILADYHTAWQTGFQELYDPYQRQKILKAMARTADLHRKSFDTVFIILDKMDKIGLEGVAEELEKEGFAKQALINILLCSKKSPCM